MALTSNVQWEIRTGGSKNNGGGYGKLYTFTATYTTLSAGAVYSHNSQTYTVVLPLGTTRGLAATGTGNPLSSGTLTKVSGTGDSTITFTAWTSGTDYSQQDSPHSTQTDIVTNDTTTLTSSSGFTTEGNHTAIIGNLIHLFASDNTHLGWYQIVDATNYQTVIVDTTVASGSGRKGYVGGALAFGATLNGVTDDIMMEAAVAGNTWWIASGTHAIATAVSIAKSGGTGVPITIAGYKTTRGDNPIGNDRPTINTNTASFMITGNSYRIKNLRFTTTSQSFALGIYGAYIGIINCFFQNTKASGTADALSITKGPTHCIGCEMVATGVSGQGAYIASGSTSVIFLHCYIHDSIYGIYSDQFNIIVAGCIIDTCTTGIYQNNYNLFLFNNTIYNCTTGINLTSSAPPVMLYNNIITNCTTGIAPAGNYYAVTDYNVWNNTTNSTKILDAGSNEIIGNPQLTDPANGDFSIGVGSPAANAGLDASIYTSAKV